MSTPRQELELLVEKLTRDLVGSESRFYNIIQNNTDAILIIDKAGIVHFANLATGVLLCRDVDAMIGQPLDFPLRVDETREIEIVGDAGETRVAEIRVLETRWEGNEAYLVTIRDITERKALGERIDQLTYYDTLTGLPNRLMLMEHLRLICSKARTKEQLMAVLYLNMNRFKMINETFGHAVGDQLLREITERLKEVLRGDDIVFRLEGDEFVLVLSEILQADDAAKVAERVCESIKRPWVINEQYIYIDAGIGIALYPGDGEDVNQLLKSAHNAMHRTKELGVSCDYQFYTPAMNTEALKRLEMETNLRLALERGEFVLHYQPQVNTSTGEIVGLEALVRWERPGYGLVPPNDFIPVSEKVGLIVPIGEWVLRTACKQNKIWQDAGFAPVRVAVNLSARQLQQPNFVDLVAQILDETDLDPKWLELEITESAAMQDVDFTNKILKDLRAMGVHLALDDFGTGFCSLGYLKYFPIQTLKIDRTFIRDILTNSDDAAILTTIIFLAHRLKVNVIAEGVEAKEQMTFLEDQQCKNMQGFLFSKPVPVGELEKILKPVNGITVDTIT